MHSAFWTQRQQCSPHGWTHTPGGPSHAAIGSLSGAGPSQPLSPQLWCCSRRVGCSWQHLHAISGEGSRLSFCEMCQSCFLSVNCLTFQTARHTHRQDQRPSSPSPRHPTHLTGSPDLCRPPGVGLCPSADTQPEHSRHCSVPRQLSGGTEPIRFIPNIGPQETKPRLESRLHTQGLRSAWGGSCFCTAFW